MSRKLKILPGVIVAVIVLSLAACSAATNTPSTGQTTTQSAQGGLTEETRLLLGTFKLEGTDQAVTPEQAATLLPLWKAVKSLSSSETTSSEEIEALYQQIGETMTTEQQAAINAMALSNDSMDEIMQEAGITPQPGGFDAVGTPSADQQATRQALRQSGNATGGGFPGGGAPSGGMPSGGGGGAPAGGGGMPSGSFEGGAFAGEGAPIGQNGEASGQFATAIAGRAGGMGLRVNEGLLNALIQLLEERAG